MRVWGQSIASVPGTARTKQAFIMDHLLMLQFASCLTTGMLAVILIYSRFQMRWKIARYERSRWLICSAMVLLTLHYVLQMSRGFRASGDDVGAVVNILFYSPAAILVSMGIINLECSAVARRNYFAVGVLGYLLIHAVFAVGYLRAGSLRVGGIVYVMLALFFGLMLFYIIANIREALRRRRIIEGQTAADLLPYDRYTLTSLLLLSATMLVLVVAIISRPLLFVAGPFMLLSLLIFVMSFVGLGYNITPLDGVIDDGVEDAAADRSGADCTAGGQQDAALRVKLEDSRVEEIGQTLSAWCSNRGFRDPGINMLALSCRLGIDRQELSAYFEQCVGSSFRVWLSEIRFQEARRMLIENPHYSNEAISSECGFSSHAHLYKVFRAKTGMTPRMYRESLAG